MILKGKFVTLCPPGRRRSICKNGKYHDLLLYGLLRGEYYETVRQADDWREQTD